MKTIKKVFFTGILSLFMGLGLSAQNYSSAIGVRGGSLNGITFKQFIGSNSAVEVIGASRWRGFHLTGLYEKHATAFNNSQFQWYYGAGGHVGFYDAYRGHPYFDDDDYGRDYIILGIDGILGLEYQIIETPFTVSVDWKPEFNITGYSGFWFGDGGLSIRYYW